MTTTAKAPPKKRKPRKKEDRALPIPEEKGLARAYHLLRAMGEAGGLVIDRSNDLPQVRKWPEDW